ncbi:alpha/beta fold hydrolase [Lactococcus sp. S47]|nr:alpha/beta hydrolase [Lactococcus sp. S47]
MINYKTTNIEGLDIFYREAGKITKPTMVLFHGFPSASHMFRDLIPELQNDFHLIAPDYPGFGQSSSPDHKEFLYTFDHIAEIMEKFLDKIEVNNFYMFVFDYGAPIGFRIASKYPKKILGIISQNGNIYKQGLGKKWEIRKDYW